MIFSTNDTPHNVILHYDTQHNDIQNCDIQLNDMMHETILSIMTLDAECRYAEHCCAELCFDEYVVPLITTAVFSSSHKHASLLQNGMQ